jgi:hypothetical protein
VNGRGRQSDTTQWVSRKLLEIEIHYGIWEKEVPMMIWEMKKFDSGKMGRISELSERKGFVVETNEELVHKESDVVYWKLKTKWYRLLMKEVIEYQVIKKEETRKR